MNKQNAYIPWLHKLCIAFVLCTYPLLISGGSVTSHGAGMSVPDWPTSFGYNMYLLPLDKWDHGAVFLEHSHRLFASVIGLLCIAITIVVWRTEKTRAWVRSLSVILLVLVIFQGLMGGFRVTQISYLLAIFHGIHAQIFFCLTVLLAAATGPIWHEMTVDSSSSSSDQIVATPESASLRKLAIVFLAVVLIQLTLGAFVRHTQSGLAIYDFPTSYGSIVPPLTEQGVKKAQEILPYDHLKFSTYSLFQVSIHFAHRVGAVVVLLVAGWLISKLSKAFPTQGAVRRPMFALMGLLVVQIALGASIIWTGRQPEVATAHQAIGAALIATATLLTIRVYLFTKTSPSKALAGRMGDSQPSSTPRTAEIAA